MGQPLRLSVTMITGIVALSVSSDLSILIVVVTVVRIVIVSVSLVRIVHEWRLVSVSAYPRSLCSWFPGNTFS